MHTRQHICWLTKRCFMVQPTTVPHWSFHLVHGASSTLPQLNRLYFHVVTAIFVTVNWRPSIFFQESVVCDSFYIKSLLFVLVLLCSHWHCSHSLQHGVHPSVPLSVSLSLWDCPIHPLQKHAASLLLWAHRQVVSVDCCTACLQLPAGVSAFRSLSTAAPWSSASASSVMCTATSEAEHWLVFH